jgi:Ca2+-binding EF-hand superfamily protein
VSLREYLDMPLRAIDGDARFDQLDRDGNGTLSSREWRTDAGAFYLADRNRDGRVTVAEFLAHADDDSVERFRSMDRNRDGYVSRAEWNGPLDSFVRRDRNRDGRVSRAEFGDAFTSRR